MSEHGYNGWTNYETWNLALWLDNDEGSYSYWREQAQDAYNATDDDDTVDDRKDEATSDLAKRLQSEVEENTPTVTGFYADILNAAISEVDWYEIASHYMDEVDTTEDK